MEESPFRILFVCTGNICRSPTAEAVFRHLVRSEGLEDRFVIDSAGTHGYHIGHPPDSRSMATALRRGVDMADLKARRVESADFESFDLILAMDGGHYEILRGMAPAKSVERLEYFLENQRDVPDPYYGGDAGFEDVFDLIHESCERILNDVRLKRGF